MEFEELLFDFNKVLVHPKFVETLKEVSGLGVRSSGVNSSFSLLQDDFSFIDGELVSAVGDIERISLIPKRNFLSNLSREPVTAYDESITLFLSLEGTAYFTSHSLVLLTEKSYLPSNYLTFYFYTKSKTIVEKSQHIHRSEDSSLDSKRHYIKDRIAFLKNTVPENSLLFVDGPIIGGDVYTYLIQSIEDFHNKNIIPVFFVKNSASNLVTNNIQELRGDYNSDLHWSYNYLKRGTRSNFFIYKDRVNPKNAKAFCYLKAYDLSPQRVEFHLDTFKLYKDKISDILDFIFYLILVQGSKRNPQIRPIAIAELYARETLKMVNTDALMKKIGIVPTMNQIRFGS